MNGRVQVILFYDKRNLGSLNALCGAFEAAGLAELADLHLVRDREELVGRVLATRDAPTLVGISFATPQLWDIQDLLVALAGRPPGVVLVAGGPHPTAMPEQTRAMGFDVVVAGAGEQAFVELVQGITGASPIRPISSFFPSVAPTLGAVGPVEITRGCPFRCGYCQTPRIFPGPARHVPIDHIVSQLAAQRAHRVRDFRFVAPNAFGYGAAPGRTDPAVVEALLAEAKAAVQGGRLFFGSFPSEVRPESVSPEMLELVKRFAHNDNLTMGLQTGSERLLASIGRGHTVAQVMTAVELAARSGFAVNVDVIFGMPDETDEDTSETLRAMRELIRIGAKIHAHGYVPLPGTHWWPRPPAPPPAFLDASLNRLIPTGRLFGHWQAQRRLAERILRQLHPAP
jgi:B12-binding domain/radical SAM domain protein